MSTRGDWKALMKDAESQGWTVTKRRKHVVWRSPRGGQVVSALTPSDVRAITNHKIQLRRLGWRDGAREERGATA